MVLLILCNKFVNIGDMVTTVASPSIMDELRPHAHFLKIQLPRRLSKLRFPNYPELPL